MFGEDDRFDIASHGEISDYTHPTRGEQGNQLVQDSIGRCLVTDLTIAIAIDVEFQAFQFDEVLIWHIVDGNGGKIGEARPRTEAGELWKFQMHDIIPFGMSIGPSFQAVCLYLVYAISTRCAVLLFVHSVSDSSSIVVSGHLCWFLPEPIITLLPQFQLAFI